MAASIARLNRFFVCAGDPRFENAVLNPVTMEDPRPRFRLQHGKIVVASKEEMFPEAAQSAC